MRSYHLRNNGVLVRHNEEFESVYGEDHSVVLVEVRKKIKADAFYGVMGVLAIPIIWGWKMSDWKQIPGDNLKWMIIIERKFPTYMPLGM